MFSRCFFICFLVCLFCVKCGVFFFLFPFSLFPNSRSLRRDKIWNVLPLYTLVMANSWAYMAKAKLILNKGRWGETLVLLFLSLLLLIQAFHTCLLKHISKIWVASLPNRALKTHRVCVVITVMALNRDENKPECCSCLRWEALPGRGTGAGKADWVVWDCPGNRGTKLALLNSSRCFPFVLSVG